MLDTATKRRIDTARDILVGKVPDPKSQVEQITIALIYKFMDDMDAEAEELGGKRSFFAGEFARYGWAKLMRSGLGGHETLGLYAEAITRMPENPGVPPLFRDIFKNAYLPYRDPETLRAFLKIIDEFEYDHSERLGDAFEYLLSVLGSQGDAGQFRTPRHIIDFIVAIVDPKKGETILDPACGTAGFLISAWKHIVAANRDEHGESTLTPDDHERIAAGIRGYDISPDMVRLSLANMYLHGFTDPHIVEYDTLTSDDRWNEYADVILANPPFMSPKGGIRPHNRFSIQATRSEVLFVDYIAEHLSPNGRAGIIVPEGIIFQSGKAYKALRKELVEKYLVAVASLPAGVFNPYSGVKTSILILDRAGAKTSDTIGFFKVSNDGFSLGAQRREVAGSELPEVLAEIADYRACRGEDAWEGRFGLAVAKNEIAASGDYNLSADRYRIGAASASNWPSTQLGAVCEFQSGSRQKGGAVDSGIPSIGGEQIDENGNIRFGKMKYITEEHFRNMTKGVLRRNDVLVVKDGATTGKTGFFAYDKVAAVNEHVFIMRANETIEPYYLYQMVRSPAFQERLQPYIKGIIGGISLEVRDLQIPLPPLEVQREIVAEIEGYQKVIDGARAVLENYRPHIAIDPEWPMVRIDDVTGTITPPRKLQTTEFGENGAFPIIDQSPSATAGWTDDVSATVDADGGVVIFGDHTCTVKFQNSRFVQGADGIKIIKTTPALDPLFLTYELKSRPLKQDGYRRHFSLLKEKRVPLPPLETQRAIVAELEAERALVEANRELIARVEAKIEAAIARVWGAAETEREVEPVAEAAE